jgi:hypothetical protein
VQKGQQVKQVSAPIVLSRSNLNVQRQLLKLIILGPTSFSIESHSANNASYCLYIEICLIVMSATSHKTRDVETCSSTMAVATDQAPDLPFEAASVLRLIRGFLECSYVDQPDALNAESAGVLLWDLSADADAAPGELS